MFEYVHKGVSAEFEIRTAVFAENIIFCEIIVSMGKHLPKFRSLQGQSVRKSNVPAKGGRLLLESDHSSCQALAVASLRHKQLCL